DETEMRVTTGTPYIHALGLLGSIDVGMNVLLGDGRSERRKSVLAVELGVGAKNGGPAANAAGEAGIGQVVGGAVGGQVAGCVAGNVILLRREQRAPLGFGAANLFHFHRAGLLSRVVEFHDGNFRVRIIGEGPEGTGAERESGRERLPAS